MKRSKASLAIAIRPLSAILPLLSTMNMKWNSLPWPNTCQSGLSPSTYL